MITSGIATLARTATLAALIGLTALGATATATPASTADPLTINMIGILNNTGSPCSVSLTAVLTPVMDPSVKVTAAMVSQTDRTRIDVRLYQRESLGYRSEAITLKPGSRNLTIGILATNSAGEQVQRSSVVPVDCQSPLAYSYDI